MAGAIRVCQPLLGGLQLTDKDFQDVKRKMALTSSRILSLVYAFKAYSSPHGALQQLTPDFASVLLHRGQLPVSKARLVIPFKKLQLLQIYWNHHLRGESFMLLCHPPTAAGLGASPDADQRGVVAKHHKMENPIWDQFVSLIGSPPAPTSTTSIPHMVDSCFA